MRVNSNRKEFALLGKNSFPTFEWLLDPGNHQQVTGVFLPFVELNGKHGDVSIHPYIFRLLFHFQSLIETVRLLDLICKIDGSYIPKAFTELKRLSAQTAQDPNNPRILLTILQFLLNHCKIFSWSSEKDPRFHCHNIA